MKDLEELAAKHAKEYELAVTENTFEINNPFLKDLDIKTLFIEHTDGIHCGLSKKKYAEYPSEAEAGEILSRLPMNGFGTSWRPSGTPATLAEYYMCIDRNPNDPATILTIHWKHNAITLHIKIAVERCPSIQEWFKPATRQLTESEISSYGIQKNRATYEWRNNFPYRTFAKGKVIHYYGGHDQLIDDDVIKEIINVLKLQYK